VKNFKAPRKALTGLDAESVAALISASADVALVLDAERIILDTEYGSDELSRELGADWIGKALIDTVSLDSRPKIPLLLADAADPSSGARQVNHMAPGGSIPLSYTLRKLGTQPLLIALGRDLRALASLQQRLIEAEQSLERDYSRLRLAEARYRLLSQSVRDVMLIIDAGNQKILEVNPQAERLFVMASQRLVGKTMSDLLAQESRNAFADWVVMLRRAGRAEELAVTLGVDGVQARVSGAPFRQENASNIMLRIDLAAEAVPVAGARSLVAERLQQLVQALPDALVLTSPEGRVLAANRAFVDMAQLASEEQARNETLDRWLGRPGVDLGVLLANLRQAGSVRLFATSLRGEHGATAEVEISAVS
jgi:transcriptional regulator PpsR